MFSLIDYATGAVTGAAVISLAPSIGRKVKALWVKETSKLKTVVVADATKVEQDLKSKL